MSTFNRTLVLATLLIALPVFLSSANADDDKYSAEELEEIVGPIALYPDIVVSSILPASAVPLDVVQAAQWLSKQEGEIDAAPEDSGWDDSVQALVQFPDVLTWMAENLDWLKELGYAMAVQDQDVLAAIQAFRETTKDAGNLESSDQQVVTENAQVIVIEPADPTVIYIPQYDPVYVVQPAYRYPYWARVAAGALGVWAFHSIRWGHWGGRGSINVHKTANFNFNRNGRVNRPGGGGHWKAPNRPGAGRPATRPHRGPGGAKAGVPSYNRPGKVRPKAGGLKPAKARPKPAASRGTASRPAARNQSSRGSDRSAFSGSSRSGSSARQASNRGRSSVGSSRSGGSRGGSRASGGSRGGSRGGGGRGGGGRGGGGRRR